MVRWGIGRDHTMSTYVLPEGMTAEKLRGLANWLDIHDEAAAHVTSSEVQNDLRRWADLIEDVVCDPECREPQSQCFCGEINARHCPVHNDPHIIPTETGSGVLQYDGDAG